MEDEAKRSKMEEEYILRTYLYMDTDTINKLSDKVKSDHAQLIKDKLSDEKKRLLVNPVLYEPKRCNRWLMRFPPKFNIQEWWVSETSRPSCTIDLSGEVRYNPITSKFRDAIGPSSATAFNELMLGTTNHLEEMRKSAPKDYVNPFEAEKKNGFDYELELIDPIGHVIEKWVIRGCKIVGLDYGKLSMDDESICEVTMILQPKDYVHLY